ncbi:response regulator [Algirhabdus cladophorae]|uniref:response regulator n=1 Tax=Algirhabdus cladophorae TaxID=3377108 RepID=UPI003B8452A5
MPNNALTWRPHDVQGGPTCLIIEDSHFDHKMMTRVIDRAQSNVVIKLATTLRAARMQLASEDISMIFLDNNLPDGTGVEFALNLATDPKLNHIPIIMVSDWPTPFMWDKADKAGVMSVIKKSEFTVPFVRMALRATTRKLRKAG